MTVRALDLPEEPPAELRYRPQVRPGRLLAELWGARELILALAERELRGRYKQAVLSVAWAIIPPVTLMLVFSLFLHRGGRIETQGLPYPLFAYVGLLPWTFFSTALIRSSTCLTQNAPLLNKMYCPREVFPISAVIVAAIDTAVALPVLALLFLISEVAPRPTTPLILPLLFIQAAFTVGLAFVVSALTVYLRDLRHALPLILQFALFATPVAYGSEMVPAALRLPYAALNPLAPVIEGYRRALLLGLPPAWETVALAAFSSLLVLVGGYALFKRLEMGFADVA